MVLAAGIVGFILGVNLGFLFAGLDGTYDFLLVAPVFLHPAEKDAKNHLTNCYGGGVLYRKSRLHKKGIGACRKDCEVDSYV